MGRALEIFFKCIDAVNEKIGNIVCFFIILIMFVVATSAVSRYLFNEPMTVVWPLIRQLFGVLVLLGAAYTLLYDRHIRIEILYDHFPVWMRGVCRVITLICFLSFLGILTWQGVLMAKISIMLKETTSHISRIPIYPFKVFVPIATFLFLIQGIIFYLRGGKASKEKQSSGGKASKEKQSSGGKASKEKQSSERSISDVPEQSENQD